MGNFGNKKRNKNRHKKVDIETKSEGKSLEESDQSEKKEDTNNNIRNSYVVGLDDVEKDLANIDNDKDEKLQDSELMDMDADMRLQRAVVEKDRKNDSFKVKSPKCSNFENMQIAQHPRLRLKLVNAVFKQFCPLFVYYIHHDKFIYRVLKLLDNF